MDKNESAKNRAAFEAQIELPPVPSAYDEHDGYIGYSKCDLMAYARKAIAHDRQQQAKGFGDPAWQAEIAHRELTRAGVPETDAEDVLTVWGRVVELLRMNGLRLEGKLGEPLVCVGDRQQRGEPSFDFAAHLQRQRDFSERTFGPGARVAGVTDHIRKELQEVVSSGGDLCEWVDVIILALDGAWRSGASPDQIIDAIVAKQTKNEGRAWPDWRTADPNIAIEHDRSQESAPQPAEPVKGVSDE